MAARPDQIKREGVSQIENMWHMVKDLNFSYFVLWFSSGGNCLEYLSGGYFNPAKTNTVNTNIWNIAKNVNSSFCVLW